MKYLHSNKIVGLLFSICLVLFYKMSSFEEIIRNNESTSDRIIEKSRGCVVINNHKAIAVKSTLENSITQGIVKHVSGPLLFSAKSAVRDLDASNELAFMRIATKKYEFLIAPQDEFTIVVLQ